MLVGIGRSSLSWSPMELSANLALWLDASDTSTIALSGSNVSQIKDKSLNARNLTQATGVFQPLYVASGVHGRPALQFAAGDFMSTAAGFGSQTQRHVFTVNTYATGAADYQYCWATNITTTTGSAFIPRVSATGEDWVLDDLVAFGNGFPSTQNPRYVATRTQSTSHNIYQVALGNAESVIRINSLANGTPRIQTLANVAVDNNAFTISRATQSLIGEISELVYIDGTLTLANRERMEGYLAWKWGLVASLPVGHPYKSIPPTV